MYNENDDQLFIKIEADKDPVEFFLASQVMEMLRATIVTKDEIRATVETGRQDEISVFAKTFTMLGYNIAMTVFVRIDGFLRVVEHVEKLYF